MERIGIEIELREDKKAGDKVTLFIDPQQFFPMYTCTRVVEDNLKSLEEDLERKRCEVKPHSEGI